MITTLGLNWLDYKEDVRSNQAKEQETMRHNTATETEANRHNLRDEALTNKGINESIRAAKAKEKETLRHDQETEKQARIHDAYTKAGPLLARGFADGVLGDEALQAFDNAVDDYRERAKTGDLGSPSQEAGKVKDAFLAGFTDRPQGAQDFATDLGRMIADMQEALTTPGSGIETNALKDLWDNIGDTMKALRENLALSMKFGRSTGYQSDAERREYLDSLFGDDVSRQNRSRYPSGT